MIHRGKKSIPPFVEEGKGVFDPHDVITGVMYQKNDTTFCSAK